MSLCLVPGLDWFCLVEVIRPSSVVDTGEFSTVVTITVLKMDEIGYNSINMLIIIIMHRKKNHWDVRMSNGMMVTTYMYSSLVFFHYNGYRCFYCHLLSILNLKFGMNCLLFFSIKHNLSIKQCVILCQREVRPSLKAHCPPTQYRFIWADIVQG